MKLKRANNFFGYLAYAIGAIKLISFVVLLMQIPSTNSSNISYMTSIISFFLKYAEIVLMIGTVVMIIINLNTQNDGIIKGYVLLISAFVLELFMGMFGILAIFFLFVLTGMYMKAGTWIIRGEAKNLKDYKKNKRTKRKY